MMWWNHGFSWEGMLFGGLMMLIFWGGLIAVAVIIIRAITGTGRSRTQPPQEEDALEILKKRYARGDIDKATFEQMRQDLLGG